MPVYRVPVIENLSVGTRTFATPNGPGRPPGPSGRSEVTTSTPESSCKVPRHELFRYVGARLPDGRKVRGPLEEKVRAILMVDWLVEYCISSVRRAGEDLCGEVCRRDQRQQTLRRRYRIRYMVSRNLFVNAVLVLEESREVVSEH